MPLKSDSMDRKATTSPRPWIDVLRAERRMLTHWGLLYPLTQRRENLRAAQKSPTTDMLPEALCKKDQAPHSPQCSANNAPLKICHLLEAFHDERSPPPTPPLPLILALPFPSPSSPPPIPPNVMSLDSATLKPLQIPIALSRSFALMCVYGPHECECVSV